MSRAWKRKIFASVPKDQQKSLYFELLTVLDTKDLQTFEVLLSGFLKKWEIFSIGFSYNSVVYANTDIHPLDDISVHVI